MWLINVDTLRLEDFRNKTKPDYTILSHRWEDDEVTFEEMKFQTAESNFSSKQGFRKIEYACSLTREHTPCHHVLVDTCCINKESSAELSEAINSIFRWYRDAKTCFAYLSDASRNESDEALTDQSIKDSLWWTRGWTLQELIAPKEVVFYDVIWERIGTKEEYRTLIEQITGIDQKVLTDSTLISHRSIAQRMSWWGSRKTTRHEDVAYSLLGIFDVNMPMLYGEGSKAFLRLQEELVRKSDDQTIFAWPIQADATPGLLAKHPKDFIDCGDIVTSISGADQSPYSITNRGVSLKLLATPIMLYTYMVLLDCARPDPDDDRQRLNIAIVLRRLNNNQFARVRHDGQTFIYLASALKDTKVEIDHLSRPVRQIGIHFKQGIVLGNEYNASLNGFRIRMPEVRELLSNGQRSCKVKCQTWNARQWTMSLETDWFIDAERGFIGTLDFREQNRKLAMIKLGFDFDSNPICFVATLQGLHAAKGVSNLRSMRDDSRSIAREVEPLRSLPDIFACGTDELQSWSRIVDQCAHEVDRYPGIWILKVDKNYGIETSLSGLGRLHIRRVFEFQQIWEVHFERYE